MAPLNAEAQANFVRELPTGDPTGNAYNSAIASNGDGFLVAWTELDSLRRGALWIEYLDRLGQMRLAPRILDFGVCASAVIWSGTNYVVSSCSGVWVMSEDGLTAKGYSGVNAGVDAFVIAPRLAAVTHGQQPNCFFHCPDPPPVLYTTTFRIPDFCTITSQTSPPQPPIAPGLGSDGHQFLVLFSRGGNLPSLHAMRVSEACGLIDSWDTAPFVDALTSTLGGSGISNPQAAWDGSQFLVVYHVSATEIRGVTIRDGVVGAPFVIAEDGRRPAVVTAREGRFLVAYETTNTYGDTQLVGRFIDFPTRRRAVN